MNFYNLAPGANIHTVFGEWYYANIPGWNPVACNAYMGTLLPVG